MKGSSSSKRFDFRTQIGRITSLLDDEKKVDEPEVTSDVQSQEVVESEAVDSPTNVVEGMHQGGDGHTGVEGIMGAEDEDLGFFESVEVLDDTVETQSESADATVERASDRDPVSLRPVPPPVQIDIVDEGSGTQEPQELPVDAAADDDSIEEYTGPIDGHGNVIEIEEETTLADGRRIADRVVQRLVRKELLTEEQLHDSLDEWQRLRGEGYKVPLWRVVSLDPRVDRERIYREAAAVYAFKEASISYREALAFVEAIAEQFEGPHLDRMIELFVIPGAQVAESRTGEVRWIFVTHDPTRPEVHRLLQQLRLRRFELRYTSESFIGELITEGFLSKNEYLDRLNEDPLIYDLGTNFEEESGLIDEEALEAEINRSSLINLFEATLVEAVK
ncbi:MAG: hypothetical protein R3178_06180, partial [Rhodothermales bacterium]|nr:hypothetical protein [Rhodothermales bacterium]